MRRAILTGATGAVGTALVKKLVSNGTEVLVFVRPDSVRKSNILNNSLVSVLECGMSDYASVENNTGKAYDAFYHLAWSGTVGSGRNDMKQQASNIKYALDAVDIAHKFGCKVFIGAGSQAEYGRHDGKLKPNTPCFPENGYGMAKLCAGQMTRERAHQLGMKHIWARILSVYGPNDSPLSAMNVIVDKLLAGEKPSLTAGEQVWDYLYADDAAEALSRMAESGKDGMIYPLGSGNAYPLRQYFEMMRDAVDKDLPLGLGELPYAENQIMYLQADLTALTNDTGFEPKVSFEEGIARVVQKRRESK